MKNHEFSIVASGIDPHAADFENRFYEAGCDDATISLRKGAIILDFTREASSFNDAVMSAIGAVRAAGAIVERVEPDYLVSLADIARRADRTRAAYYPLCQRSASSVFPRARLQGHDRQSIMGLGRRVGMASRTRHTIGRDQRAGEIHTSDRYRNQRGPVSKRELTWRSGLVAGSFVR